MDLATFTRVDFLPRSALAFPGRLGLTKAPGRFYPGRHLDARRRLREDLSAIRVDEGARVLVTLLERAEMEQLGDLGREARRAGLEWIHFPIPDFSAPADVGPARKLVERILGSLERGEGVVLHCWGGLGRAGTIAAACLVASGSPLDRAVELVRCARPGAIQSDVQERFLARFAAGER
jgi:ADP-ribosyl-[dinitrogen reductase] hydrolase